MKKRQLASCSLQLVEKMAATHAHCARSETDDIMPSHYYLRAAYGLRRENAGPLNALNLVGVS